MAEQAGKEDPSRSEGGPRPTSLREKNRRTALRVGALALFFFVLLFVKRLWLS